jgi:beta-galactosidase
MIAETFPGAPLSSAIRERTFTIGEREFLLDGEPFVIRCGEIHFPRVPREYWRHRLKMCRALGLNAVCVYLFWNFHEWEEGVYDWAGQADAAEFCRLAQEEGLWVLLRPGPYSCAEWEMGGLPWWLLKRENVRLRSSDPLFLEPATQYLREVGRVLGPQQITHGGPILMVQVENEYGSFGNDAAYMGALRQALIGGGFEAPLFACNPVGDLANGWRDDLFQVVNFGAGAMRTAFERLREFQPTGPLMNGEYYPAWFDMWGRRHRTGPSGPVVADIQAMLKDNRSFSLYMAHGGTSFGLWAGADRPFSPDTTSYDYDAPISESGSITPKFDAIRVAMSQRLSAEETLPTPPLANPIVEISSFALRESASLFESLPAPIHDSRPRTMEFYGQGRGAILYRTTLPAGPEGLLVASAVHDFGWAFLDGEPIGVMDRRSATFRLHLPARERPARLDLFVYAMGRVNFGEQVLDRKGLHAPVEFDGKELEDWSVYPLPLDEEMLSRLRYDQEPARGPAVWRGVFELEETGDAFLDMRSWGKGVVWINGRCLGRFWNVGPQQTLYMPAPWLKTGRNEVLVMDLLGPSEPRLAGLATPILDELRPDLDFSRRGLAGGVFVPTTPAASGAFSSDAGWQRVQFERPIRGRYVALEALSALDGGPSAAVAGLQALGGMGALSDSSARVLWVSSEETNYLPGNAEHALDGQTSTYWHSEAGASALPAPHRLVIDLGESREIGAIRYLPRSGDETASGRIRDFRIYVGEEPFGLKPFLP